MRKFSFSLTAIINEPLELCKCNLVWW